jgi:hypothetical protein
MRLTETFRSSELCSEGTIPPAIPMSDQRCRLLRFELLLFFGIVQTKCVVVVSRLFLRSMEFQRER